MRLILLAFILSFFVAPALAQKCELNLEQAPELRGFKLGMPLARARLAGVDIPKSNKFGVQEVQLPGAVLRRNAPAASGDVKRGTLSFLDGRLMRVEVVYADSVGWKDVDEFTSAISQSLGLPPSWPRINHQEEDDGYRTAIRMLFCSDFHVIAILQRRRDGREAIIGLENPSFNSTVYNRRLELEERKKAVFKP